MFIYSTNSGAPSTFNAGNFVQSITGSTKCEMVLTAEVFNPTSLSWDDITNTNANYAWATGFSTTTGGLTVSTANSYTPYLEFRVRVTYTSKFSKKSSSDRQKIDEFWIRLQTTLSTNVCDDNTLTKTNEIPNW